MDDALYKNLDILETEELLYKVSNTMLTEAANSIALNILQDRGVLTEKIIINENNEVKAYGLASKNERNLSWNTFINMFICLFFPVIPAAVLGIGSEFTNGMNIVIRVLVSFVTIAITLLIIKIAYKHLFEKEDKLAYSSKVLFFVPTISVSLFFIVSSVVSLFK